MPTAVDDHWSRFWTDRRHPDDYYPSSETIQQHLAPHVHRGSRVLEVGAGTGRDAAALRGCGATVVVLDLAAAALELSARGSPDLRGRSLVQSDALRCPFANGSFDIVFHQGLLEHFRDPQPLLQECRRVLATEGLLLVDVPQTYHPWTVLKHALIAVDRWFAGWETQYTATQLERLVRNAGFDILTTYGDWMRPSLAYRSARAALAKIHVPLPQQPPSFSPIQPLRRAIRQRAQHSRLALLTTCTVGVLARKRRD